MSVTHSSLGHDHPKKCLQFDYAVHASSEPAPCNIATAVVLEAQDATSCLLESSTQSSSFPCSYQACKPFEHLEGVSKYRVVIS